jgi:SAM-dependent methyltransferase
MSPREYNPRVIRALILKSSYMAVLAGVSALLFPPPLAAQSRNLAPYVPTPSDVVDRMLTLAKVGPRDVVYDLGCGDGRMVIAAAKKYGTRGVGVDLDPARIREARANAKQAGVESLVTFKVEDLFETDLREATVVLLYLLPELNRRLKPKLFAQLQPGARVVSHDWDMGKDWPPDQYVKLGDDGIYLWVMPDFAARKALPQTGSPSPPPPE